MSRTEQIAMNTAIFVHRRTMEQNHVLLSACKLAYSEQMHPGSVVATALLEAIRSVEPRYPARPVVR